MTEVGVHLEDVLVVALQRPFETGDVGGAQSELPLSLMDEQSVAELCCHEPLHDGCGAVGRPVVNDQYMETFLQPEDGPDDFLDVLLLVVGGYDYDAVTRVHSCSAVEVIRFCVCEITNKI